MVVQCALETKTNIFRQIKIILLPKCILTKRIHTNTSWMKEEDRGVQKSEVAVTSAFETMKKTEVIQSEKWKQSHITKTCLYNIGPLKPHFYIVKLGFTGVYIIFVISAQNIDCGYSLEPPRRGGSNEYPQSMFWVEIWKISEYFIW